MYKLYPGDVIIIQSEMVHRTESSVGCCYFDFHFEVEINANKYDFSANDRSGVPQRYSRQHRELPASGVKPSQMELAREAAYWMEYHLHTPLNITTLAGQLRVACLRSSSGS